jgi:hypothetical protein
MTASADTEEAERVLINRLDRFMRICPDYPQALELAMSTADLHLAEDMVAAGCPPELLVAILI